MAKFCGRLGAWSKTFFKGNLVCQEVKGKEQRLESN